MPNTNLLIEQMQQMLRRPATDYGNMIWDMKYGNQSIDPEYDTDYTTAPDFEDEFEDFDPYSDNNIGNPMSFVEEQLNSIDPMQFVPTSNINSAPEDYDLETLLQELHDYYLNN